MNIFDTPDDCTAHIPTLKADGIKGVIRYDDPSGNPNSWKQIGAPEYAALLHAGIAVGIVSEWANTHAGYFNAAAGERDGKYSLMRAKSRGQPVHSAIYSTVDYDASAQDIDAYIIPYFRAFSETLRAAEYRTGAYGSGLTCAMLKDNGLIDFEWITCSSGFSGSRLRVNNRQYDLWQIFGLCDQSYHGLSADWDQANPYRNGDWGQATAGGAPIPAPEHDVAWMQGELNKLLPGDGHSKAYLNANVVLPPLVADGVVGPLTIDAMIKLIEKIEAVPVPAPTPPPPASRPVGFLSEDEPDLPDPLPHAPHRSTRPHHPPKRR
jgi:hypothetical protein